jgi:hypothetical protein
MVYVLAPFGLMVKFCPAQIVPLFTVIVGFELETTAKVEGGDTPQEYVAVIDNIPDDAAVVIIEFELLDPDQPPGKDQL